MKRTLRLAALLVALSGAAPASAETRAASAGWSEPWGLRGAEQQLRAAQPELRLRAIERLAELGSVRAIELLAEALEPHGAARRSEERLLAVRGLARYAATKLGRQALLRAMNHPVTPPEPPLARLTRETAALALSAAGDDEALTMLGQALRHGGATAELAALALLAHPPRDLAPLLRVRGAPTLELVRLLGQLGDQRAFAFLRRAVLEGAPEVRAAAAVALTELGALEPVQLAEYWASHPAPAHDKLAAARILVLSHAPRRDRALLPLLEEPATLTTALHLARAAPHAALLPAVLEAVSHPSREVQQLALDVLARLGTDPAVAALRQALGDVETASSAAYALALSPASAAAQTLEQALTQPHRRRLAARAAVVRWARLGDRLDGLGPVLEALLSSAEPADRAVGAWGIAALDPERGARLLRGSDPVVVRAVARHAPRGVLAAQAAERLLVESSPAARAALGICLHDPVAAERVPSRVVLRLLDEIPALVPLAAFTLARRGGDEIAPRVDEWLTSSDPLLRAHAARGLGLGRQPSAAARLRDLYRFEIEAEVRQAAVDGLLASPPSPIRDRTLAEAARLDPDREVRRRAQAARPSSRAERPRPGRQSLWLHLEGGSAEPPTTAVLAIQATGIALPLLPDPDGLVSALGLPEGFVRLRLAAVAIPSKAPSR